MIEPLSKRDQAYHLHVERGLSLSTTARMMRISVRLVRRHVAAARERIERSAGVR